MNLPAIDGLIQHRIILMKQLEHERSRNPENCVIDPARARVLKELISSAELDLETLLIETGGGVAVADQLELYVMLHPEVCAVFKDGWL